MSKVGIYTEDDSVIVYSREAGFTAEDLADKILDRQGLFDASREEKRTDIVTSLDVDDVIDFVQDWWAAETDGEVSTKERRQDEALRRLAETVDESFDHFDDNVPCS